MGPTGSGKSSVSTLVFVIIWKLTNPSSLSTGRQVVMIGAVYDRGPRASVLPAALIRTMIASKLSLLIRPDSVIPMGQARKSNSELLTGWLKRKNLMIVA